MIIMRAGLLTNKIEILRPEIVKSSTGFQQTVYNPDIVCRAYVKYNSAGRSEINGEVVFTRSITFQIRRFYDFDENCRIRWKYRDYRILSIEHKRKEQLIEIITEIIEE